MRVPSRSCRTRNTHRRARSSSYLGRLSSWAEACRQREASGGGGSSRTVEDDAQHAGSLSDVRNALTLGRGMTDNALRDRLAREVGANLRTVDRPLLEAT